MSKYGIMGFPNRVFIQPKVLNRNFRISSLTERLPKADQDRRGSSDDHKYRCISVSDGPYIRQIMPSRRSQRVDLKASQLPKNIQSMQNKINKFKILHDVFIPQKNHIRIIKGWTIRQSQMPSMELYEKDHICTLP